MKIIATLTNKKLTPMVSFQIAQAGRMDYRVIIIGIGEYGSFKNLGDASAAANRIAFMSQDSLDFYIAEIQNANDRAAA